MSDLEYEDILAYFNNFDSRKNGVLDFSEFAELIQTLGFNLEHHELQEGFKKIDTDHNNEIDFEEFMVWWGKQK